MQADGVRLHVARAGDGPPVVLLHGFPEYWRSWRHQIPALLEAGFSVWVPDLRGYNLSDRPTRPADYHLRKLVSDIVALVKATGSERAHIVGHDWGGILAFTMAGHHKEQVDKLVVMNAPHFAIYMEKAKLPPQIFASWYTAFFQLPLIPEALLSANNFAAVRKMFRDKPVQKQAFSPADIDDYIRVLAQPGALTAAINYYRAGVFQQDGMKLAQTAHIDAETLIIWGEKDVALTLGLLDGLERYVPKVRIHRIARSGHWVQNEVPDEVNKVLTDFLLEPQR